MATCQWEQAAFIFHAESGQTHFINQSCLDILNLLADAPATDDELYARMCERYAIDEDLDLQDAISRTVELLDTLGVICRAD